MLCLPSIRLASELIVHETCLMISLFIMRTERKTCVGDYTYFFFLILYFSALFTYACAGHYLMTIYLGIIVTFISNDILSKFL